MKATNVGDFLGKSRKKKKKKKTPNLNKTRERIGFAPIQVLPSAPGQHKTKASFKKVLTTGIYRDFQSDKDKLVCMTVTSNPNVFLT